MIDHGVFRFTDTAAHSDDHKPQHCYAVKFSSEELWGEGGDENLFVTIDAFDDYLLPAS